MQTLRSGKIILDREELSNFAYAKYYRAVDEVKVFLKQAKKEIKQQSKWRDAEAIRARAHEISKFELEQWHKMQDGEDEDSDDDDDDGDQAMLAIENGPQDDDDQDAKPKSTQTQLKSYFKPVEKHCTTTEEESSDGEAKALQQIENAFEGYDVASKAERKYKPNFRDFLSESESEAKPMPPPQTPATAVKREWKLRTPEAEVHVSFSGSAETPQSKKLAASASGLLGPEDENPEMTPSPVLGGAVSLTEEKNVDDNGKTTGNGKTTDGGNQFNDATGNGKTTDGGVQFTDAIDNGKRTEYGRRFDDGKSRSDSEGSSPGRRLKRTIEQSETETVSTKRKVTTTVEFEGTPTQPYA